MNHRDIELELFERVRQTYDGSLTMADDLTVLNVTKDHIEVREVTFNHEAWPMGTSKAVGYRSPRRTGYRINRQTG